MQRNIAQMSEGEREREKIFRDLLNIVQIIYDTFFTWSENLYTFFFFFWGAKNLSMSVLCKFRNR